MEKELPEHKCGLYITHNRHLDTYEDIETYINDNRISDDDWATPTSKERAIEINNLWELQWYPNTPVGFNIVYGATLQEVLDKAKE